MSTAAPAIVCPNCGAGPTSMRPHCTDGPGDRVRHAPCDLYRCTECRSFGNRLRWSEDPRIKQAGHTPVNRANQPAFDPNKDYGI